LQPGERVVAEGVQKVTQGVSVQPRPFTLASTPLPAPTGKSAGRPATGGR